MKPIVSIVIVCMNKFSNLEICLPSIEKFTMTPHKIYVVAYLFSPENLEKIKCNFPYVNIIESNEIRGFSENNNLALREIDTEYTFILNDDTEFIEPVLDKLLESLKKTSDATVMSPVQWNAERRLLSSGRRKETFGAYMFNLLFKYRKKYSKFENQDGIFMSYTVSGAAFLIYTEAFKEIGFFNEFYFFCPEDVEVGHKLNAEGKHCYVDSNANIIHFEAVSSKKTKLFYATSIAQHLGTCYFFGKSIVKRWCLLLMYLYKLGYHKIINAIRPTQHHKDYIYIYKNVYSNYFKKRSPKEAFIEEYQKII